MVAGAGSTWVPLSALRRATVVSLASPALLAAGSLGAQDGGGVAAATAATAATAGSPAVAPTAPKTVLAVNVAGLALGVTSLEGERALGRAVGVGAGVTHWSLFSERALAYASADLRLRWHARAARRRGSRSRRWAAARACRAPSSAARSTRSPRASK